MKTYDQLNSELFESEKERDFWMNKCLISDEKIQELEAEVVFLRNVIKRHKSLG
jgi:hypothetical protein